jgi:hypothetical protein
MPSKILLLMAASALLTVCTYGQPRLLSISNGDAIVREWNPTSGSFLSNAVTLIDSNGLAVSSPDIEFDGEYFYALASNGRWIKRFGSAGNYLGFLLLREANGDPIAQDQSGLATDGKYFYTIALNDHRIRKFTRAGFHLGTPGSLRDALGLNILQIGFAADGTNFYAIAANDYRIRKFDLTGDYLNDVPGFNNDGLPYGNNTGLAIFHPGPPIVTVWPTNQVVLVRGDAYVVAEIMGARPVRCQWLFNGLKLPRQTNSFLSLSNIHLRSRGRYQIEVRNSLGKVRSESVRIQVVVPPSIITQPRAITAKTGGRVILHVTATGSRPKSYQWFKDGDAIATGTNRIFRIPSVQAGDAGVYAVRVSNIGAVANRIIAELTVAP